MRWIIRLAVVVVTVLAARPCSGFSIPLYHDSVERMVHRSAGVARVRIETVGREPVARVVERIKGEGLPEHVVVPDHGMRAKVGEEWVVFLDASAEVDDERTRGPRWKAYDGYRLTEDAWVGSFDDAPLKPGRLLDVVRAEARRPANPNEATLDFHRYPLDERFYALANRYMGSPDPERRASGVRALHAIARPEDLARFRALLDDPYCKPWGRGRYFRIWYPVRDAARDALARAGQSVAGAITTDPHHTAAGPAHLAVAAAPPVLLLGFLFLLRDRRRPQTVVTRLCGVLSAVSLALAVILATLVARSIWRVDQVLAFTSGDCRELTSTPGAIQFVRFDAAQAPEPRVMWAAFAPGSRRDELWRFGELPSATDRSILGVRWVRGSREGPHANRGGRAARWWGVRVPYAWPLAGTLGTFATCRYFRTRARRRLYAKRRICPGCGYDLRAATGQCPECAWALPAV